VNGKPAAARSGPWTLRTRGTGTLARSWVTAACTGCGDVLWDEDLGMTVAFASVEQAREDLPRDWGWCAVTLPGGPEHVLCPRCAALLAASPAARAPGA
jgi:hypothetical protein